MLLFQICYNINRVKTCMGMGRPVILLNLDDLYESLYDLLNQYFSIWDGSKYVHFVLGNHRVKSFVHDKFRLVHRDDCPICCNVLSI